MLIAIDASRASVDQRTGTEGYSYHIIRGLIAAGREHRFRLYFRDVPPDGLIPPADNVEVEVIHRYRLWTHAGLGPAIRHEKPDVLFVPSHVVPWPNTGTVPAVVTAHDLGYLHYPDKHPLFERLYLNWSTRHSARAAWRMIAVSNATKQDLVSLNGVPAEKIRVVHSGVDTFLHPVDNLEEIARLKSRLGISGPYILHVGRVHLRKNLPRLVEAFHHIKDTLPELTLVLAGRDAWGQWQLLKQIRKFGLEDRVILPGYVADADLPALYSGASVYAFPSLYEGFGFPALEAMACGTPVVCANTSSLPEIVGDAALSIAPTDVIALSEAMARLLTDADLSAALIERGKERARKFTWEASARATLDALVEAATG